MAGRHGHKSTVAVQDPPTGPRHRTPDRSSTTVTVADLVPGPRGAAAVPTSPPAEPQRSRRWPWLVLLAVVLVAIAVARFTGDPDPGPPAAPPAAVATPAPGLASAPAAAPAGMVTLPRIGGRNAEVAIVALKRMGLTDVRLVTDDDRTVDDPGKWTVIGIQPKPGTAVPLGRTVVLTVSQQD